MEPPRMTTPDLRPLAELRHEIETSGLTPGEAEALSAVRHRAIQEAAMDGRLPGAVRRNGRWYFDYARLADAKDAVVAIGRRHGHSAAPFAGGPKSLPPGRAVAPLAAAA